MVAVQRCEARQAKQKQSSAKSDKWLQDGQQTRPQRSETLPRMGHPEGTQALKCDGTFA